MGPLHLELPAIARSLDDGVDELTGEQVRRPVAGLDAGRPVLGLLELAPAQIEQVVDRHVEGRRRTQLRPQVVDQLGELGEALLGSATNRLPDRWVDHGLTERHAGRSSCVVEGSHRGGADPALGRVDDPLGCDLVGGVHKEAEVGQDVLDLAALVEPDPTDHLVGDAGPDQLFLDRSALGVGPIEDGDLFGIEPLVSGQPRDLVGDPHPLVTLIGCSVALEQWPWPIGREEPLLGTPRVVGDHCVGRVEDVLGGAEVLLEDDGGGIREGALELQDVGDVRRTESIDRLIRVTDHADVAVRRAQQGHEAVLHRVGVLELVDQDVAEPVLVAEEDVLVVLEHLDRAHEEVVEVHGVGLGEP